MTSRRSKMQRRQQAAARGQGQGQDHVAHTEEIIGRTGNPYLVTTSGMYSSSVDVTRPDYGFWDSLRYGTHPDYLLGGLFAEPITTILSSWVFGDDLGAEVDEARMKRRVSVGSAGGMGMVGSINGGNVALTNDLLDEFMTDFAATLQDAYQETLALGDTYVITNPDSSLTVPSPSEVKILTTPEGSLNITGYRLTTKLDTETIIDTYTLEGRTYTVKRGALETTLNYPNLIGAIPVTHIPTSKGTNELYGRPVYARQRRLFSRYDKVINKAADGAELLGNPIPSLYGAENPKDEVERLATDKTMVTTPEGKSVPRYHIDLSKIPFLVTGKGARMEFVGPGVGFTGDAEKVLGLLFLLMLQFSGIPEWAWGGAIASSKASVDSQLPAFVMLINRLRRKLEKKIAEVARNWLAYKALYIPGVIVAPPKMQWSPVVSEDKQLLLDYIKFAAERGLITDETALSLTNLVDNPGVELDAAKKEAAEANPDSQLDDAIDKALKGGDPNADGDGEDDTEDDA